MYKVIGEHVDLNLKIQSLHLLQRLIMEAMQVLDQAGYDFALAGSGAAVLAQRSDDNIGNVINGDFAHRMPPSSPGCPGGVRRLWSA
jgi:hypothetical protein